MIFFFSEKMGLTNSPVTCSHSAHRPQPALNTTGRLAASRVTLPVPAAAMMHRSRSGSGETTFTREEDHATEEEEQCSGEETSLAKKPRLNGDEDLLDVLKAFRSNWTRIMSPYTGPVDAISTYRMPCQSLLLFSNRCSRASSLFGPAY